MNQALSSLNEGSLYITLTVPLKDTKLVDFIENIFPETEFYKCELGR